MIALSGWQATKWDGGSLARTMGAEPHLRMESNNSNPNGIDQGLDNGLI